MDACIFGGDNPCDPYEQEEALAVLEAWRGVRMPSGTFCSTVMQTEVNHTRALAVPLRASIESTPEALNEAAEQFLQSPDDELLSSLVEAAGQYAEKHYGSGLEWTFRHDAAIMPKDVLQAFSTRVFELLSRGRYGQHKGQFERWLGTIWKICHRAARRDEMKHQSKTLRIIPTYLEADDEPAAIGFVDLWKLDAEQAEDETGRTSKNHVNVAGARKNLVAHTKMHFAVLNDPATGLASDTKLMMQGIAQGLGKAEAANSAGVNERTARRRRAKLRANAVAA